MLKKLDFGAEEF